MENSNDTGKLIGAILLGAAVGVGIGVLFAPEKGSETRKKIINGLKDIAEELNDTLNKDVAQADESEGTSKV
jgi:gas vesicle protein